MKSSKSLLFLTVLFLFANIILLAKPDSTVITIQNEFNDKELNMMAKVIEVNKTSLSFSDTNLIGKKLFISKSEFINGEKKEEKDFLVCKKDSVKTVVGKDTFYYPIPNVCEYIKYKKEDSLFVIHFLCDNSKDSSARINIHYPEFMITINIQKKDIPGYVMKDLLNYSYNYKAKFPINEKLPIFAFTPPFEMGNGVSNYCILSFQPVEEWYKFYKLNHYVVFYLEIKD